MYQPGRFLLQGLRRCWARLRALGRPGFAELRGCGIPIPRLVALVAFVALALLPVTASALERHPPPAVSGTSAALPSPNVTTTNVDATPLGPNLSAIVLIGLHDPVAAARAGVAVDASRIPLLDDPAFIARLDKFIGKPISGLLIAQIEAEIAKFQRERGYPFVSVSTPPQEITGGTVRFRVVEFHAGKVTVAGEKQFKDAAIRERIRLATGDRIASGPLSQDIDWLNRSPFRHVTAQFTPGTTTGISDLQINTVDQRPWNVFAGYGNSGSNASPDRYLVGATVGDVLGLNSLLSVQLTGSPNFWANGGWPLGSKTTADYASLSGRASLPLFPRSELDLTANAVGQNSSDGTFTASTQTVEGRAALRAALSNFVALPGNLSIGVQARREERTRFFGGVMVDTAAIEVYQALLGWDYAWSGKLSGDLSVTLHGSPGGIGANNTGAAFSTYTQGRVTNATYGYVDANATLRRELSARFALSAAFTGQAASGPLPGTEQAALGGLNAVRGYTSDDGSYDNLAVLRSEFLFPRADFGKGRHMVRILPYIFADFGTGSTIGGTSVSAASAGIGSRLTVGRSISGEFALAHAFSDAPATPANTWSFYAKLLGKY